MRRKAWRREGTAKEPLAKETQKRGADYKCQAGLGSEPSGTWSKKTLDRQTGEGPRG